MLQRQSTDEVLSASIMLILLGLWVARRLLRGCFILLGCVGVLPLYGQGSSCNSHSKKPALIASWYEPLASSPVLLHVILCSTSETAG